MSSRDNLIPRVRNIRRIPANFGLYVTTVYLRTETYSAAIKDGVTLSSATETAIDPTPKVRQMSTEDAAFYGGGVVTDGTGLVQSTLYEIGPLTPNALGVGYTLTDLLPSGNTPTVRKLLRLTGPDFQSDGELCQVIDADNTRPFRIMLTAKRIAKVV